MIEILALRARTPRTSCLSVACDTVRSLPEDLVWVVLTPLSCQIFSILHIDTPARWVRWQYPGDWTRKHRKAHLFQQTAPQAVFCSWGFDVRHEHWIARCPLVSRDQTSLCRFLRVPVLCVDKIDCEKVIKATTLRTWGRNDLNQSWQMFKSLMCRSDKFVRTASWHFAEDFEPLRRYSLTIWFSRPVSLFVRNQSIVQSVSRGLIFSW